MDSGDVIPVRPNVLYPRVIPKNHHTLGFYIVLVVCTVVWAVTPLS